jgi:hypothetical protein
MREPAEPILYKAKLFEYSHVRWEALKICGVYDGDSKVCKDIVDVLKGLGVDGGKKATPGFLEIEFLYSSRSIVTGRSCLAAFPMRQRGLHFYGS